MVTERQQHATSVTARARRICLRLAGMTTKGAVKTSSLLLALALSALASRAAAESDVAACVADHKRVQTARESGHYLESREAAARCAQASCPQLIREDCAGWYVDVADSTPSIVLDVRDREGRDVSAPEVTLDEHKLDVHDRAIALDPGSHELRVEAAGFAPHVERILLRQGERNRRVAITLVPSQQPARQPAAERAFSPAVIALGTLGVVGLSTFAALGISGRIQHSRLDDQHCEPDCTRRDVDAVNRMYVAADVAAAIGGTAAIAATVLYVLDRRRERRLAQRSLSVGLHPLGLSVRGAF
jgi:hypothetical protein